MSTHIDNLFFQVLQCSIGNRHGLDTEISEKQWEDIYKLSMKHAVVGIVGDVVTNLPQQYEVPLKIKLGLAIGSEVIVKRNKRTNLHMADLKRIFNGTGMQVCVLKGQGLATLYPNPDKRQSGDIDLWVNGRTDDILSFLKRGKWKLSRLYSHHIGVFFFNDKIDVEVHFFPSWFNNPFKNKKLKKYFAEEAPSQFNNENESLDIAVTNSSFNCFYILLHIFRHFFDEGVGFRQLCDYYYVLVNSSDSDREKARRTIRGFSLVKFTSGLMWVMQEVLLLDDKYILFPSDEKRGRILLEEILISGNFGFSDKRNDDKGKSLLHHAVRRLLRLVKFIPINASEVLWAPLYRIYQYFWRISKGYRY